MVKMGIGRYLVVAVALLAYQAYNSYLFRVAINFRDNDPHLSQLDAIVGLAAKVVLSLGLLTDITSKTRRDLEAIEAYRKEFRDVIVSSTHTMPSDVYNCYMKKTCRTESSSFKSKVDGREIEVLIKHGAQKSGDKFKKLLMYYYSGGGVIGYADLPLFSLAASKTDALLISVEYRRAPENPYPAGFNDCYEALEWAIERFSDQVESPLKISLLGESAGGMMVTAVAQKWNDQKKLPKLDRMFVLVPMLGPVLSRSYLDFENIHLLPMRQMAFFWDLYAPNVYDCILDVYCSPISASSDRLKNIANKVVVIGGRADVLYSEAAEYANKLSRAGVNTTFLDLRGSHLGFVLNEVVWQGKFLEF